MADKRPDTQRSPATDSDGASSAEAELAREQREHDRQTTRAVDQHLKTRDRGPKPSPTAGLNAGVHDRVEGGNAETVEAVDFDDDELGHERGGQAAPKGTDAADGADSGKLGPPGEQLSATNQPRERDPG